MTSTIVYLHGFRSSPQSTKATQLAFVGSSLGGFHAFSGFAAQIPAILRFCALQRA